MKKTLILLMNLIALNCFSQQFEGKITYQNAYQSKEENTPSEYLTQLFGNTHIVEIKNENYKLNANGELLQYQIFLSIENKLYTKLGASEKLGIKDLKIAEEKVKSVEVNRKSIEILTKTCDEFIVYCKNSTQKYFIESSLNINSEIFKTKNFNYRLAFLLKNKIIPLKMIIEDNMGICESTATEINEEKIDESTFEIK
jgi:uncharacterized protein YjfI (DUF2170 family)